MTRSRRPSCGAGRIGKSRQANPTAETRRHRPKAMKQVGPWLAAALLLTAASALAGEVSDYDRFQLWNACNPMGIVVALGKNVAEIGLTEKAVETATRSRLRSARLYDDDRTSPWLAVVLEVAGTGFIIEIEYFKRVHDLYGNPGYATSWSFGGAGTHGNSSVLVLGGISQYVDQFIDEYLRVNEDACK